MTVRSTRHPFDGALYELQPDGNIKITDGDRQGIFGPDGQWISGELRVSDPQLCVWVGNNPELQQVESDSHLAAPKTTRKGHPLA
jgi:hypothetical protein